MVGTQKRVYYKKPYELFALTKKENTKQENYKQQLFK